MLLAATASLPQPWVLWFGADQQQAIGEITRFATTSNLAFLAVGVLACLRLDDSPVNAALALVCANLAMASADWHLNSSKNQVTVLHRDLAAMLCTATVALAQAVDAFLDDASQTKAVLLTCVLACVVINAAVSLNRTEVGEKANTSKSFWESASFVMVLLCVPVVGVAMATEIRRASSPGGDWRRAVGLALLALPSTALAVTVHAGWTMESYFGALRRGPKVVTKDKLHSLALRHDAACGTFHTHVALTLCVSLNTAAAARPGEAERELWIGVAAVAAAFPLAVALLSWRQGPDADWKPEGLFWLAYLAHATVLVAVSVSVLV